MVAVDYLYGVGKPLQDFDKWKHVIKETANGISEGCACIPDDFSTLILLGYQSDKSYRHAANGWLCKDVEEGNEIERCHGIVSMLDGEVEIKISKVPCGDSFPVTLELGPF